MSTFACCRCVFAPKIDNGNPPSPDRRDEVGALITHVTDRDQGGDLNAQADAVQAAATAFGSNVLKVFQRERATLYVHMVVAHVAPLIRRWGNLVKFGGQGCVV